jgi:hypothetical protein
MGFRQVGVFVLAGLSGLALSQVSAWDFGVGDYDRAVPRPFVDLGFDLAERHITSSEAHRYVQMVDAASDRVVSGVYGKSYENREMPYAIVSSPKNLARLESIVAANRKLVFDGGSVRESQLEMMPLVMWIGCGVHGNEASGVESGLTALYHLAADRSGETKRMLDEMVIIIAPNYNPDGRDRFANWVNARRGKHALADNQDTEHSEPWPGGRTNHYWFDLNRDWFPLTQVESSTRHELVMKFRPQVILDYHEQGGENYFFQPGVLSRVNPFTPKENQALTKRFAAFHARALEKFGEKYFTEQRYDDFYIGKGSTYPDVTGSIGILFEQASSRALVRETADGVLTFGNTVRNQVVTTLSSLRAALAMRVELLGYQRRFFLDRKATSMGYSIAGDQAGKALVNLLLKHEIEVYESGRGYVVPVDQPLWRLVEAMFSEQTTFEDTLFYDISSWSLAHVTEATVNRGEFAGQGRRVGGSLKSAGVMARVDNPLGFVVRAGVQGFHSAVYAGLASGRRGFYVTRSIGPANPGDVYFEGSAADEEFFGGMVEKFAVSVDSVAGETGEVVSWGGNALSRIAVPRLALIVGDGVDSNNTGEQWWTLDRELDIPVALIDVSRVGTIDLKRYSAVLLAGSRYPAAVGDALATYVSGGGTVVATASGANWAAGTLLGGLKLSSLASNLAGLSYREVQDARSIDPVPGAIFRVSYDETHPLAFGQRSTAVFREGGTFWELPSEPGTVVARYADDPLVSGFVADGISALARGKAAVVARRLGSGRVVLIADNPCFRGYMTAQRTLWLNGLLFSRAW